MQIPKNLYNKMLDIFMPSREMREYLKTQSLNDYDILEIILGAPIELTVKNDFLQILREFNEEYNSAYIEIQKALNELHLKKGELFYLKEKWYDTDDWLEKESGNAPCLTVERAMELITDDLDEDEDINDALNLYNDCCCWAELEKWIQVDNDFKQTYNYYFIKDKICYFEEMEKDKIFEFYLPKTRKFSNNANDINLPVPFKTGDIVKIDCTPFAPLKYGVVLEVGNNSGCCCFQVLYKDHNNIFNTGAVKHSHLFMNDDCNPLFSPLYRMEKVTNDLPESDKFFEEVSKFLKGDESIGAKLYNMIDNTIEEKLKEIIGEKI